MDNTPEDRCVTCGAHLAHDQRYCVECGERRGQSTLPRSQPATEVRSRRRVRTVRRPGPPPMSSSTTLVAGVAVLLLAIGLGVLIGRLGHTNQPARAAAVSPMVITVGGGAAGGAASVPTTTAKPTHVTKVEQSRLNAAAHATAPPSAAVQKKAVQAAGKVLGNSSNLAPPTVTTGQKCGSNQAGCSGGSFNGNFFGP